MPTLKSVKSLWYRALRGAPLTPRTRYRSPFPFTELFHRDYSALFIRFVSQPRSPQPSSVHVFSSVLRPRLRNRSPSLSPLPFSILVFSPVHRIRHRNRPSSSSLEPSSVPSPSFVLHPRHRSRSPSRLRYRPPSSFSALFTGFASHSRSPSSSPLPSFILVSGTVLHPRFQPPSFFGCN